MSFPHPLHAFAAATAALVQIRSGDHGLDVDPDRVGIVGSSAGGHLGGWSRLGEKWLRRGGWAESREGTPA